MRWRYHRVSFHWVSCVIRYWYHFQIYFLVSIFIFNLGYRVHVPINLPSSSTQQRHQGPRCTSLTLQPTAPNCNHHLPAICAAPAIDTNWNELFHHFHHHTSATGVPTVTLVLRKLSSMKDPPPSVIEMLIWFKLIQIDSNQFDSTRPYARLCCGGLIGWYVELHELIQWIQWISIG